MNQILMLWHQQDGEQVWSSPGSDVTPVQSQTHSEPLLQLRKICLHLRAQMQIPLLIFSCVLVKEFHC